MIQKSGQVRRWLTKMFFFHISIKNYCNPKIFTVSILGTWADTLTKNLVNLSSAALWFKKENLQKIRFLDLTRVLKVSVMRAREFRYCLYMFWVALVYVLTSWKYEEHSCISGDKIVSKAKKFFKKITHNSKIPL